MKTMYKKERKAVLIEVYSNIFLLVSQTIECLIFNQCLPMSSNVIFIYANDALEHFQRLGFRLHKTKGILWNIWKRSVDGLCPSFLHCCCLRYSYDKLFRKPAWLGLWSCLSNFFNYSRFIFETEYIDITLTRIVDNCTLNRDANMTIFK